MKRMRVGALVATAVVAVGVGLGSLAWACTDLSVMAAASPPVGPGLSATTVSGQTATRGGTSPPVEIRWDSASGPLLATAVTDGEGRFSTTVGVPAAAPGVYTLVAVTPTSDGAVDVARSSFQVLSSAASPAPVAATQGWTVDTPTAASSGPGGAMVAGAALLGVGLVGTFGLAGVIAVRRRRAVATH